MSHPRLGDFINEGTNHSYYPLWHWPDLVKVIDRPQWGVCQVQSESQTRSQGTYYVYVLTSAKTLKPTFHVFIPEKGREPVFRKLTFGEFLWYRDPNTKGRKIGKNKAWPVILSTLLAIYGIIAFAGTLATEGFDVFTLTGFLVCLGVPAIFLIGTYGNYTGRWK